MSPRIICKSIISFSFKVFLYLLYHIRFSRPPLSFQANNPRHLPLTTRRCRIIRANVPTNIICKIGLRLTFKNVISSWFIRNKPWEQFIICHYIFVFKYSQQCNYKFMNYIKHSQEIISYDLQQRLLFDRQLCPSYQTSYQPLSHPTQPLLPLPKDPLSSVRYCR